MFKKLAKIKYLPKQLSNSRGRWLCNLRYFWKKNPFG